MKINKSELFKKAWDNARIAAKKYSEYKALFFGSWIVRNEGVHLKASDFFAACLKEVWADYKRPDKIYVEPQTHCNSWYGIGAKLSEKEKSVVDMMQRGDNRSAYDEIEMSA